MNYTIWVGTVTEEPLKHDLRFPRATFSFVSLRATTAHRELFFAPLAHRETPRHSLSDELPTHQEFPQLTELLGWNTFGKDVRLLHQCIDLLNTNILVVDMGLEEVVLDGDVLGPRR